MGRGIWTVLLAALPAGCAPADAPAIPCGDPAVLQEVAEQVRRAGRPVTLEDRSVAQVSVEPGRPVQCAVRAHMLAFDTPRFGKAPLDESLVVHYSLELRRNGIFVQLLP